MCSFSTEKASLAASTPENKWKFHPWKTPTTVHRLVEAEQAPPGSHHHINKQGVGQGARCLVLVRRAAKARRARGINRVKVGSLDRRLHAPQDTALTTLANAQQQCNGIAEKRSYTQQQRKLLLSWGDRAARPRRAAAHLGRASDRFMPCTCCLLTQLVCYRWLG
jgi:hypothetical protein